jgi:serine protease Do
MPAHLGLRAAALAGGALLFCSSARAGAPDPRRSLVVGAVDRVKNAVVNVSTEQVVRQRAPGPAGEVFEQFFRDFYDSAPRTERKLAVTSLGSGVFFDGQGDVLTNYHVIARGARIKVSLADGREFEAKVVGTDPDSDIAVLHVAAPELPAAPLAPPGELLMGETAIAIGNPFGLSHSVTTGVVSAVHRSVRAEGRSFYDFIQTDAAINPGNSGGPLLNINGEVIGINTAIYGEGHGIGFAIPIDRARLLAQEILTHGEVRESWLGLSVNEGPAGTRGVRIVDVEPSSPAAAGALVAGDLLLAFNGTPVQDPEEFRYLMRGVPAGQVARLKLLRGEQPLEARLVMAEFPVAAVEQLVVRRLGLEVAEVAQPGSRAPAVHGVAIRKIHEGSPGARVGLLPGDIIRAVNSLEVSTLEDFRRAVRRARRSGSAILLIQRGYALEQIEFPL